MEKSEFVSKLKKPWQCLECKDSNKRICKHLEMQLPKPSGRNVYAVLLENIDQVADSRDIEEIYEREIEFRNRLRGFGLEEIRVEVVTLRCLYSMSYAIIARELCIPSRQMAYYIFRRSLELLEERGLNIK